MRNLRATPSLLLVSVVLGASPLLGDAATEAAVVERMGKARFLHFATHGLLEAESSFNQSLLSALAFAPSPGEDGFLTAKERLPEPVKWAPFVLYGLPGGGGRGGVRCWSRIPESRVPCGRRNLG